MTCTPCKLEHQLSCRVTVQQVKTAPTVDANGEVNLSDASNWETYCTRFAEIKTRGGSERFASDMIQAGQTHRIYMRADTTTRAITPRMRVLYGTRVMAIQMAADIDQQHIWMQLDVAEEA